jgi:hypothetical protein
MRGATAPDRKTRAAPVAAQSLLWITFILSAPSATITPMEGESVKKPRRLRRWNARAMLLDGKIAHVEKANGQSFHTGFFASNEGPVPVEIRELRPKKA